MHGNAIQEIFNRLPGVYERINHIISLGLDVLWRRKAASLASAKGGAMWLDVSTGTGEMAAQLRRLAGTGTTVVATDFSLPMLLQARRKKEAASATEAAPKARKNPGILFAAADTGCLPFRPGSFDLVTISFATRNITTSKENLISCLAEFHRVLKPGGWLVNLETSQPDSPIVRRLFHGYVDGFLKPVAAAISGSKSAYSYLSSTIRSFYDADELAEIMRQAGFGTVSVVRLFAGTAAIHKAEKATSSKALRE
ncbi:MAG: ubiquinone/menaquinone biosynthesis methyltransferase [Candidatus Eisenbacteria bacterium]|nr:ubiquinone/menaquinone biosynthesis methyltransferase [Candidatus Eisenbacteria bacterium]